MPRFDVETLRTLAGEAVFARGESYFREARVEIVSGDMSRVRASVAGSEPYATELTGTGEQVSGTCTCVAFSEWGFCKHLVATGLAANALSPGEVASMSDRSDHLHKHLVARGAEALADMILRTAERDARLRAELELTAAAELDDNETLSSRLKKAVTQATRTGGYVEYGQVEGWAEAVRELLDQIEALTGAGRATVTLAILDHLLSRLEAALESIDDSDGVIGGLFAAARKVHLAACEKARPDPIDLARQLFHREVDSDWEFFDGASIDYAGVLGEAGLAEYRSLAEEAWRAIKSIGPANRRDDEHSSARYRIGQILESFAERDGDVDARIAIRSKDLSSSYAYLGIAQLCLDSGREVEALKWAEDGLFLFEDDPDERLIIFAADLHQRAGRGAEAKALLWRSFEREPSMMLYWQMKAFAGGDTAQVETARDLALARLRAGIETPAKSQPLWSSPVELLLTFLLDERLLTEAWAVVRSYGCSEPQLERLAAASEESHPAEALNAYARRVERLVGLGGNGNYERACKIIRRMAPIQHRLGADDQHASYLDEITKRHKAKRNFVKLLAGQR